MPPSSGPVLYPCSRLWISPSRRKSTGPACRALANAFRTSKSQSQVSAGLVRTRPCHPRRLLRPMLVSLFPRPTTRCAGRLAWLCGQSPESTRGWSCSPRPYLFVPKGFRMSPRRSMRAGGDSLHGWDRWTCPQASHRNTSGWRLQPFSARRIAGGRERPSTGLPRWLAVGRPMTAPASSRSGARRPTGSCAPTPRFDTTNGGNNPWDWLFNLCSRVPNQRRLRHGSTMTASVCLQRSHGRRLSFAVYCVATGGWTRAFEAKRRNAKWSQFNLCECLPMKPA